MSIGTGIMVYLMLFWTVLFVVLPWGNRPDENVTMGHAGSAPANARLPKKFLFTAIISAVMFGVILAMIKIGVVDFYAIANDMVAEDKVK